MLFQLRDVFIAPARGGFGTGNATINSSQYYLFADTINVNKSNKIINASGNVKFQNDKKLTEVPYVCQAKVHVFSFNMILLSSP